jgi:hypothetical protein
VLPVIPCFVFKNPGKKKEPLLGALLDFSVYYLSGFMCESRPPAVSLDNNSSNRYKRS